MSQVFHAEPPPRDTAELLKRARALSGRRLGDVARDRGVFAPASSRRGKGWAGTLIEAALGGSAGSAAAPDFPDLGIELKTVPVNGHLRVLESTWVCSLPLDGPPERDWVSSWVYRKLQHVLWVPVLFAPEPADRRVGAAFLWMPSADEEAALRQDWEDATERVQRGGIEALHARFGEVLQVRPKAASSRERTWVVGADGQWTRVNPRGFYLRPAFTEAVLRRNIML